MATRDVPSHPVTAEEAEHPKGVLGKIKETLGLGGAGAEEGGKTVTESVKETAQVAKEKVTAPGTPGRAGAVAPVCPASEVGGRAGGAAGQLPRLGRAGPLGDGSCAPPPPLPACGRC